MPEPTPLNLPPEGWTKLPEHPFDDPRERRAFALRTAVEMRARILTLKDHTDDALRGLVLADALAFDAYLTGAEGGDAQP